ncbi:hypothetical protein [Moorena sp. SIO4G3]|nr:hypothetical protein [Moorena sp. SIO4G3]
MVTLRSGSFASALERLTLAKRPRYANGHATRTHTYQDGIV